MLIILIILAGAASFTAIKLYSGDDKRLPPISTKRGKEARLVVGSIFALFILLLLLNVTKDGWSKETVLSWAGAFILGGSVPVFRYIQFKNKNKKK